MSLHVNIGDAKTRLSELVAAAVGGEEVVIDKAGEPQVRLVPVEGTAAAARAEMVRSRVAALGMYRHLVDGQTIDVRTLKMTDEEQEESYRRKFGPAD